MMRALCCGAGAAVAVGMEPHGFDSAHWAIEKYTLNVKTGTGLELQDFLIKHQICEPKTPCPTDLGCGGLRSWCLINTPYASQEFPASVGELHFVESPVLHDGGVGWDAWQQHFEDLNGDLSGFNAFMHNKVQVFTEKLPTLISSLQTAGVSLFQRRSKDREGRSVAHVAFALAGRMFELVGSNDDLPVAVSEVWAEAECPTAHLLTKPLSWFESTLRAAQLAGNNGAPLLISVSMSSHRPSGGGVAREDLSVLYRHLQMVSGAQRTSERDGHCSLTELSWPSMPGFAVRYVHNSAADLRGWNLRDLDAYAAALHANFTGKDSTWRSWDHMLDQHLGLWYGGPADACAERAATVRKLLEREALPVGERHEPDAHLFYVGYAGPMTWEYQFTHCDAGRPDWPQECACDPDNNPDNVEGTCDQKPDDWCIKAVQV